MSGFTSEYLALHRAYHWEKTQPDAIYLTQPSDGGQIQDWTWKQALDEARRMATHLQGLDLPPKSHVALISKNCAHWILADLAIMMAGHVSVPLYPTLAEETVSYVLEHSEARLLFVGKLDGWEQMKPGVPDDLPCIAFPLAPPNDYPQWDDIVAGCEPLAGEPKRELDELATIVYTSGSTGRPKGVMLSFRAMGEPAFGIGGVLNINPNDRILSYLPLAHVMERWLGETCSLVWGFRLYFAEKLETFLQDLQRSQPTLFVSVPRLWLKFQLGIFKKLPPEKLDRLLKIPILSWFIKRKILKQLGLNHVRFAGTGSAPIPAELIGWYRKLGLELLEGYGMSENFAYSHMSMPGRARPGYVGEPHPGVEQRISEEGEIQIKSPGMMMGYYKAPDKTAESFTEDGWLKTGDRGEIDEAGRLRITGRVKELFKTSKGKYIAPAPIESQLLTHTKLEQACVTGAGYPKAHAIVLLSEDAREQVSDDSKKQQINQSLEAHLEAVNAALDPHEHLAFLAVIREEWQVENGFLTPTMKIKRNVIEDAYSGHAETWYGKKQSVIWHG